LGYKGICGMFDVGVESDEIKKTTQSEDYLLYITDAEERRHRYQTGLDTLVVYAVNDGY